MKRIHGEEAKANFDKAMQAVKEGRYDDARAITLRPSDYMVIERRIAEAMNTVAKRADQLTVI